VSDEQLEAFEDDELALLSNKFKCILDNRRSRRRTEGCCGCGDLGHHIADCPIKEKIADRSSRPRRKGSDKDRKPKGEKHSKKTGRKEFNKKFKAKARAFLTSLSDDDSDDSSSASSDSDDELPTKRVDVGLCFITDSQGDLYTMALETEGTSNHSSDTSNDEVSTSADLAVELDKIERIFWMPRGG